MSIELDFRKDPRVLGDILDAMPIGVFSVDSRGCIVTWSAGAEQLTGFGRAEVFGQPCGILEAGCSQPSNYLADILSAPPTAAGSIHQQPLRIVTKDGTTVDVLLSVRLVVDRNATIGAVGSFTRTG